MRGYARTAAPATDRNTEITVRFHHEPLNELADRLEPSVEALLGDPESAGGCDMPDLVARIDPPLVRAGIDVTNRRFIAQLRGQRVREGGAAHVDFAAAAARAGVPLEAVTAGYRL